MTATLNDLDDRLSEISLTLTGLSAMLHDRVPRPEVPVPGTEAEPCRASDHPFVSVRAVRNIHRPAEEPTPTTVTPTGAPQGRRDILVRLVDVYDIATAFTALLRSSLTHGQMVAVVDHLRNYPGSPFCRSHDFVDANVLMAAAFASVFGRMPEAPDQSDADHMNRAWAAAREALFDLTALRTSRDRLSGL